MRFITIFLLTALHVAQQANAVHIKEVTPCKGGSEILSCPTPIEYKNTFVRFNSKLVKDLKHKYKYLPNGTLLVENVSESDEGLYSFHCKYKTNCLKSKTCKISLNMSKKCEVIEVNRGSSIKLYCKATRVSETIKDIKWTRKTMLSTNITKGQPNKTFSGRLNITLDVEISDVRTEDQGVYYCAITFDLQKHSLTRRFYKIYLHVISNNFNATTMNTSQPELPTTAHSPIKNESTEARNSTTFATKTPIITRTKSKTAPTNSLKVTSVETTMAATMAALNGTGKNTTEETMTPTYKSCSVRVSESYLCAVWTIITWLGLGYTA